MPSSSHGSRLGRLLQRECLAAIGALAATGDVHARVHEARKAIRRARSLLALAAPELDVEAADAILRRTGDSLGALRDAHAVTLTALRLGKRLSDPRWRQAATVLALRADRLARRELAADPGFAKRRKAIGRAVRRLDALPWHALKSAGIREGLLRQSRRVERAAQRVNRDPTPDNLHAWRRRARRLRMQLDALDGLKIRIIGHDPTASKRLHRLSDRLGRQQDLVVLAGTLRRMRTLEHRRELLQLLEAATPTH